MTAPSPNPPVLDRLLAAVAVRARAAGVFGEVTHDRERLTARAAASAAPAEYRVDLDRGVLWVSLVTADRWLSQSIEADLVHTGDKLEELIAEELVDQGAAGAVKCEHYRSEDKLFTFRTPVPIEAGRHADPASATLAAQFLLAYEACFRRLGDMEEKED